MSQYQVTYNEDYILNSLEQYRRQRHVYPWFIAIKIVCALGLALLIAIVLHGMITTSGKTAPLLMVFFTLAAFLVLLLQGPRLDYMLLKRRLRKSPFYGDEINISVSEDGVSFKTQRSQATLNWSAFTFARRVGTGFLVFTDPKTSHWWPDAALTNGTLAEIKHHLRTNIPNFEDNNA
jgi:hypothetical protein